MAILADDLTGAADCAVPWTRRGRSVLLVCPDAEEASAHDWAADIVTMSTESREVPWPVAERAVIAGLGALRRLQPALFFKKVDTLLRGNTAAEMILTRHHLEKPCAVIAPAYPRLDRTTRGGWQYAGGRPVASILEQLRAAGEGLPVGMALDVVARGADVVEQALLVAVQRGQTHVVIDATDDTHLDAIAAACLAQQEHVVMMGSGGLSAALSRRLSLLGPTTDQVAGESSLSVVVVAGSRSHVCQQQIDYFYGHTDCVVRTIAVGQHPVLAPTTFQHAGLVLHGDSDENDPVAVQATLAVWAEATLHAHAVAGLVLTGGATATAVLHQLGAWGIDLVGEPVPGVALGSLRGGLWNGLPVATKAGAFGEPDALVRAARAVRLLAGGQGARQSDAAVSSCCTERRGR